MRDALCDARRDVFSSRLASRDARRDVFTSRLASRDARRDVFTSRLALRDARRDGRMRCAMEISSRIVSYHRAKHRASHPTIAHRILPSHDFSRLHAWSFSAIIRLRLRLRCNVCAAPTSTRLRLRISGLKCLSLRLKPMRLSDMIGIIKLVILLSF